MAAGLAADVALITIMSVMTGGHESPFALFYVLVVLTGGLQAGLWGGLSAALAASAIHFGLGDIDAAMIILEGADGALCHINNSRRATYVQQQYAIRNPRKFRDYGEHVWGITASNGPGPTTRRVSGRRRRFRHRRPPWSAPPPVVLSGRRRARCRSSRASRSAAACTASSWAATTTWASPSTCAS